MGKEWVATVGSDGREIEVALVRRDNGSFVLVVDSEELQVDAAEIGRGTWSLLIAGRSHLVDLTEGASLVALSGSAELALCLEDARRKRLAQAVGGGADSHGETVRAPIAGRVVKILVALGAEVEAGNSLVVLEAMKMENEIKASRGGTVEAIHAEPGQAVDSGHVLIVLT